MKHTSEVINKDVLNDVKFKPKVNLGKDQNGIFRKCELLGKNDKYKSEISSVVLSCSSL